MQPSGKLHDPKSDICWARNGHAPFKAASQWTSTAWECEKSQSASSLTSFSISSPCAYRAASLKACISWIKPTWNLEMSIVFHKWTSATWWASTASVSPRSAYTHYALTTLWMSQQSPSCQLQTTSRLQIPATYSFKRNDSYNFEVCQESQFFISLLTTASSEPTSCSSDRWSKKVRFTCRRLHFLARCDLAICSKALGTLQKCRLTPWFRAPSNLLNLLKSLNLNSTLSMWFEECWRKR